MPNTFTKIASVTVGLLGASSMDFTSIPATYTDLCIKISGRGTNVSAFSNLKLSLNGSTSTFTRREIYAESGAVGSEAVSDNIMGVTSAFSATSNTFGSAEIYIPNYAGSTNKSISIDSASENNSATQAMWMTAGLWSTASAITSLGISLNAGSFVQYSTATLYGIKNS